MVAAGKYQIVTRSEIDQLLNNQKIAVSDISSAENVKKLQLQNISYIVTGSVDAMDADYAVTVKILDVSTGQFSHSANDFMGGTSRELYAGVNTLVAAFVKGMSAEGGQVAQAGSQKPKSGVSAAGIGIEVSTVLGGTLYFEGEETAALWDNDSYTIPIERPGTYRIRIVFASGQELSRDVTITSRGIAKVSFVPPPPPENPKVGSISAATAELTWASAGQGISYRIYSGTSNNPGAAALAGTAAGTYYRVTNLKPETTYYFWLSSVEGTLEGGKGQVLTAKTISLFPPGNLRAGKINYDTVELTWDSAGQGISYRVYSATSNNPAVAALAGTSWGTSYRATNLMPGTEYYFWLSSQEGSFESGKSQTITAKTPSYTVGGPGPAGGIVFYDKGNSSGGWRYLEAAPASAEFRAEWGLYGTSIFDLGTEIGKGKSNTGILAARGAPAAQRCVALNIGGYSDWFLPSAEELWSMYINLKRRGLGGFDGSDEYWSSSVRNNEPSGIRLYEGFQGRTDKDEIHRVRAVRAF
jgi:fibronectin type 3 domain-containing protein